MKTSELIGPALDWAVAKCEGELDQNDYYTDESKTKFMLERGDVSWVYSPSTRWPQGGPIIERETISVGYERFSALGGITWDAVKPVSSMDDPLLIEYGPTPLVAAMRCYVASKLGNEVDVPEGICA